MRNRVAALLAAAATVAAPTAQAFGTLPGYKGSTGEHERITRRALACEAGVGAGECFQPATIDQLAGTLTEGGLGWGAVGAPDRSTQVLKSHPHCDNGDRPALPGYPALNVQNRPPADALEACRAHAAGKLDEAVRDAGAILDSAGRIRASQVPTSCVFVFGVPGRAKCDAIEAFGVVLHASQDFYSHSNWTDPVLPGGEETARRPQGLGQSGPAAWMSLRSPAAPLPVRLLTGCFALPSEASGCVYTGPGGARLERVMHEHLNKDTGEIPVARDEPVGAGTTSRGAVGGAFRRAVDAAVLDTEDKWRLFQERLVATHGAERGKRIACAIRSDDPVRTCA
ncbi:MAG TPA: hypothetical protein VEA15_09510 [Caulobacteraceae bacterium]|nr:hypothetical protein [Caulobacteraceae bacterium]